MASKPKPVDKLTEGELAAEAEDLTAQLQQLIAARHPLKDRLAEVRVEQQKRIARARLAEARADLDKLED